MGFCVLNCYCSISLVLSLWVDIEIHRLFDIPSVLYCLEENHDKFSYDLGLGLFSYSHGL